MSMEVCLTGRQRVGSCDWAIDVLTLQKALTQGKQQKKFETGNVCEETIAEV